MRPAVELIAQDRAGAGITSCMDEAIGQAVRASDGPRDGVISLQALGRLKHRLATKLAG